MNNEYFTDNISDESLVKLTDKMLNFEKTKKLKSIKSLLFKTIPAIAAIALVIGLINMLPFLTKVDVATELNGDFDENLLLIAETTEFIPPTAEPPPTTIPATTKVAPVTEQPPTVKTEPVTESPTVNAPNTNYFDITLLDTEYLMNLPLEEMHNILWVYETKDTVIERDENGKVSKRTVGYSAEETVKYNIVRDIYGPRMAYAYDYLERNTGNGGDRFFLQELFFDYKVVNGEFYVIIDKLNIMSIGVITNIAEKRKIAITAAELEKELQKILEDFDEIENKDEIMNHPNFSNLRLEEKIPKLYANKGGKSYWVFNDPDFAIHLENYYDVVVLPDGRWAFKAIEKVDDPEAVNFQLKRIKDEVENRGSRSKNNIEEAFGKEWRDSFK